MNGVIHKHMQDIGILNKRILQTDLTYAIMGLQKKKGSYVNRYPPGTPIDGLPD